MSKTIDLTPSMKIPSAEVELQSLTPVLAMGQNIGGVSMFANAFKRGYGNNVFGSDERGIWLGAADYDDAPFKVSMAGVIYVKTSTTNYITIDGNGITQWQYDAGGDIPVGFWGFQENGF